VFLGCCALPCGEGCWCEMRVPGVAVGQVWVARPGLSSGADCARYFLWMRFFRVEAVDDDRVTVRTVKRQDGCWQVSGKRTTTVRLSRFDGSFHNYGFVENCCDG
jgi:hypothetical protein